MNSSPQEIIMAQLKSSTQVANSSAQSFSPLSSPQLGMRLTAEFNPGENDSVFEKSPCISFDDEHREESKPQTILQVRERQKWRKMALAVTMTRLLVSVIFAGASFFLSATMNSSSVLATALDTTLTVLTCFVLVWRFHEETNAKIAPQKEKHGSIAFGIAFIVDALIVIAVSVKHLTDKTKPDGASIMWPCLLAFCFVYCLLAGAEFWISSKLKSSILIALSIDDGLTGGFMFALSVNEFIECKLPNLWYLDHSAAIAVSLMLLYCGIKILVEIFVYKKLPFQIFNSWFQEDTHDQFVHGQANRSQVQLIITRWLGIDPVFHVLWIES